MKGRWREKKTKPNTYWVKIKRTSWPIFGKCKKVSRAEWNQKIAKILVAPLMTSLNYQDLGQKLMTVTPINSNDMLPKYNKYNIPVRGSNEKESQV